MFYPDHMLEAMSDTSKNEKPLISPFIGDLLGPASYDLRLSDRFKSPTKFLAQIFDNDEGGILIFQSTMNEFDLETVVKENPAVFETRMSHSLRISIGMLPKQRILASSMEKVCIPNNAVGKLAVRSTVARQWLDHSDADSLWPGFEGNITFELINNADELFFMEVSHTAMQFSLIAMMAPARNPYKGRFQNQNNDDLSTKLPVPATAEATIELEEATHAIPEEIQAQIDLVNAANEKMALDALNAAKTNEAALIDNSDLPSAEVFAQETAEKDQEKRLVGQVKPDAELCAARKAYLDHGKWMSLNPGIVSHTVQTGAFTGVPFPDETFIDEALYIMEGKNEVIIIGRTSDSSMYALVVISLTTYSAWMMNCAASKTDLVNAIRNAKKGDGDYVYELLESTGTLDALMRSDVWKSSGEKVNVEPVQVNTGRSGIVHGSSHRSFAGSNAHGDSAHHGDTGRGFIAPVLHDLASNAADRAIDRAVSSESSREERTVRQEPAIQEAVAECSSRSHRSSDTGSHSYQPSSSSYESRSNDSYSGSSDSSYSSSDSGSSGGGGCD